jgi:hypothetical protein
MWSIIVVHTKSLKHFGTFKTIEEDMQWAFGINSLVEMNYYQSLCLHYWVVRIQFGCNDNL